MGRFEVTVSERQAEFQQPANGCIGCIACVPCTKSTECGGDCIGDSGAEVRRALAGREPDEQPAGRSAASNPLSPLS